jgi:hypothetical protein
MISFCGAGSMRKSANQSQDQIQNNLLLLLVISLRNCDGFSMFHVCKMLGLVLKYDTKY